MSAYKTPKRADDLNSMRTALRRFADTFPHLSPEREAIRQAASEMGRAVNVVRRAELRSGKAVAS